MSQAIVQPLNPPDQPEREDAPQGANLLLSRLTAAFPAPDDTASQDTAEPESEPPQSVSPFAGAALRQAKAVQTLVEQIQQSAQSASVTLLRDEISPLQQLLTGIAGEARQAATSAQARQASLAETIALLGGHLASQQGDSRADKTALQALTDDIQRLRATVEMQATENAQLRALITPQEDALRQELTGLKDSNAALAEAVGKITARLAQLEDDADALKENETARNNELGRVTRRLVGVEDDVQALSGGTGEMARGLAAANTDMRALRQRSEQRAAGLRAIEQAVETLSRRDRILAQLHQQAAAALRD